MVRYYPQNNEGRAIGAILFSIVIGLLMAWLFRNDAREKGAKAMALPPDDSGRPLWQTAVFFATMVGILVFANWSSASTEGFFATVFAIKWWLTGGLSLLFAALLARWYRLEPGRIVLVIAAVAAAAVVTGGNAMAAVFVGVIGLAWLTAGRDDQSGEWFNQTWLYTKQIMPLLPGRWS